MTDYVEPPSITLDNDDPSLIDKSVRAFIDAENTQARSIFSKIARSSDEREQMQLYSDTSRAVHARDQHGFGVRSVSHGHTPAATPRHQIPL